MIITETTGLTPVEKRGSYFFKREDFYAPFGFSPANGSKLRQCQLLVKKNWDTARNGIITGTSVISPQSVIASSVAKSLNVPCTVYFGGTTPELLAKKKYPSLCDSLGASLFVVSKMAYTSVLSSKAHDYAVENNVFHIKYGFDLMQNTDVFLDSVANQAKNIPQEVKNIVITVGSAITLLGLLVGIAKYATHVEKVYGVGCAPDRRKKIQDYADLIYFQENIRVPIEKLVYIDAFNSMKGYKYENTMNEEYYGIVFHPRYEAKAFRWLKNNPLDNSLFWITGCDF